MFSFELFFRTKLSAHDRHKNSRRSERATFKFELDLSSHRVDVDDDDDVEGCNERNQVLYFRKKMYFSRELKLPRQELNP